MNVDELFKDLQKEMHSKDAKHYFLKALHKRDPIP